ncbi:hypothetical protein LXA43DRAFT_976250 [Ganoderma leucocontextum]|nr:hypothetical protein LXA43DRAFT_976250 [Ganoderma leucocontextum]
MSVAPSSPSTPIKDKNASATTTNGAPSTPTHKPFVESENVPPTPEVRLNGQRTSTSSLRGAAATPSRDDQGGGDGWGSKFWVTLVDPQTQVSFFACPATGEVSWDPPVGNFLLPPSPDGEWWEMFDEASGLHYYYHTKSGETVWERPNAFVIPLGILQNTALARRLSLNRGVHPRASSDAREGSKPTPTSERAPYRRSRSYVNDREGGFGNGQANGGKGMASSLQSRRSQSSTRNSPGRTQGTNGTPLTASNHSPPRTGSSGRRSAQSPRKSTSSADQLHHSQGSHGGPLAYERGHPLAPIPGSPYNTDAAPTPAPSVNGRPSLSGTPVNGKPASKKDSPRSQKSKTDEGTYGRSRSKSSSYMEYRSPQPQSLTAALEMIALSSSQSSSKSSSSVPSALERRGISESGHGYGSGSRSGSRSVKGTPLPKVPVRINTDPRLLSGASLSDGMSTPAPETPLRFKFMSLGKDKSVPPRSVSGPVPVQIRGKGISNPVLNPEASRHMSQLLDRHGGTPIPIDIYEKTGRASSSLNTGKYPVLPQDLASDIQQFAESEFAKQYFSTHRTGFIFKRTVPVSEIMAWQKTPITSPLLNVRRELSKDAVKAFRVVQRIMGDRERDRPGGVSPATSLASSVSTSSGVSIALLEEERWLLGVGLSYGELRDEIYCQVMKQLNGNPNTESIFRGWQLVSVLLVTFPPSKNFETYLQSYIQQATTQQEGRVDIMAKYCLRRLAYISKKGPRGKPPERRRDRNRIAFHPSIFGEPLDTVFRLQERNYPDKKVPIILPFLADGILALGGTKSEGIFRVPGDGDLVSDLKLRIGRGYYSLDSVDDPHVLASLLKLWLRELIDPLVPDELYNDCITNSHNPEALYPDRATASNHQSPCCSLRDQLPTTVLEDKTQTVTKMTSANLALVMAPNLLRCNSESMVVVFTNSQYEQRFVHNLLLHLKCEKVDPDFVPAHGHGAIPAAPTTPSAPRRSTNKRTHRPNY